MGTLQFPDITWRAVRWGEKNLPPLINRIDNACNLYLARTGDLPNVILLREADFAEAQPEYQVRLPNGKTTTVEIQLSPIPGKDRELLVGRKEIVQP